MCTGACSERAAYEAIYEYYRLIQRVEPLAVLVNIKIQNMVSTCFLGKFVDCEKLHAAYPLESIYDPELFPGVRLYLEKTRLKSLIFLTGKVNLAGAKDKNQIKEGWKELFVIVENFLTDEVRRAIRIRSSTFVTFAIIYWFPVCRK